MSNIQEARDVLAKWREKAATGAWTEDHIAEIRGKRDGRLIVGTAGNPDLLDAISEFLLLGLSVGSVNKQLGREAERIAAAIIAAEERMNNE